MVDASFPGLRRLHEERTREALAAFFAEQSAALRPGIEDGLLSFDRDRWNRQLTATLLDRGQWTATDYGQSVFTMLGRSLRFDPALMDPWLEEWSANSASSINAMVFAEAEGAMTDDAPVETFDAFMGSMVTVRAGLYARSVTTTTGNFGAQDGARAGGGTVKSWRVTSGNPRSSHAMMAGQSVALDAKFSNSMRWPGDPAGGAAEVANCRCALDLT